MSGSARAARCRSLTKQLTPAGHARLAFFVHSDRTAVTVFLEAHALGAWLASLRVRLARQGTAIQS